MGGSRSSASGEDGRKRLAKLAFGVSRKPVRPPPDEIVRAHEQSPACCESGGLRPGAVAIEGVAAAPDLVDRDRDAEGSRRRRGGLSPSGTVIGGEHA